MKLYDIIYVLSTTGPVTIMECTGQPDQLHKNFDKYSDAFVWTVFHDEYNTRTVSTVCPFTGQDGEIITAIILKSE